MPQKVRKQSLNEFIPPTLGRNIISERWKYPPTKSPRTGKPRDPYDIKYFIRMTSTMFSEPVIIMSDLHDHGMRAAKQLAERVDLSKYIVFSLGDMSGQGYFGSDGDPTPTYEFLAEHSRLFYFVQGNHDLPAEDGKHLKLENDNGTKCMIQNRQVISTPIGKISGINGIISRKPHPYKMPGTDFYSNLARLFHEHNDIDILLTHETPKLPIGSRYIGKDRLFDMIVKYSPKFHFYGHCYHPSPVSILNHVTFVNADDRILVFDPSI